MTVTMTVTKSRATEAIARQHEASTGLRHGDANRARQKGRELAQRLLRDLEKKLFGGSQSRKDGPRTLK